MRRTAGSAATDDPSAPCPAGEITEENLDFMLDTNVKATVFTNQAAYRLMREAGAGGRIINLGSGEAVTGITWSSSYALAKAGGGARVDQVGRQCVGPVRDHGQRRGAGGGDPGSERFREFLGPQAAAMIRQGTAQNRPIAGSLGAEELGDPVRDLGPVLVFLAGEGSRFVTGQLLAVGGGSMMLGG